MHIKELKSNPKNPRKISDKKLEMLRASLIKYGDLSGFVYNRRTQNLISGHQRQKSIQPDSKIKIEHKYDKPTKSMTVAEGYVILDGEKFKYREVDADVVWETEALLAANKHGGEWDDNLLKNLIESTPNLKLDLAGFDIPELKDFQIPEPVIEIDTPTMPDTKDTKQLGSMVENFIVPPFSILNAREGYWKDRKDKWLSLGIKSELGRPEGDDEENKKWKKSVNSLANLTERNKIGSTTSDTSNQIASVGTGVSIFDPVLTELAYRWFCPPEGNILDPFAGGSVRGIVASHLKYHYTGIELRNEQVEENISQAKQICEIQPIWICGDSRHVQQLAYNEYDFIFTCPPYVDLEVYSENPNDLSTLNYHDFLTSYRHIISESCKLLKPDRFACIVVGEVRDKKTGSYYNFVGDTIRAFLDAGMKYFNEMILVTNIGSLPIRAGKQFKAGRKIGKTHQNVLVFCKGDSKKATLACGDILTDSGITASEDL